MTAIRSEETSSSTLPSLSVVVPYRNEVRFAEECIRSIAASDYPDGHLEIVAVDGMSDDGTRAILAGLTTEIPYLQIVDNPDRTTPFAFNRGIRASRGDVVAILNGHSVYPPAYLRRCVETLVDLDADLVGGVMTPAPRDDGIIAKAFARALSHPFGIGNAKYRTGANAPTPVDVVGYGCYRRTVFDRVGYFDERLTRSQDMDLNARLRKGGGKIVLEPRARYTYSARSGLLENWKYNFGNGRWVSVPIRMTRSRFSLRHMVPGMFLATLLTSGTAAPFAAGARRAFAVSVGAYALSMFAASLHAAIVDRDPDLLVGLPIAFPSLHLSYGAGTLWGAIEPLSRYQQSTREGALN